MGDWGSVGAVGALALSAPVGQGRIPCAVTEDGLRPAQWLEPWPQLRASGWVAVQVEDKARWRYS